MTISFLRGSGYVTDEYLTIEEFEAWENYAAKHPSLVAENHSLTLETFLENWRRGVKLLAREQTTEGKL